MSALGPQFDRWKRLARTKPEELAVTPEQRLAALRIQIRSWERELAAIEREIARRSRRRRGEPS